MWPPRWRSDYKARLLTLKNDSSIAPESKQCSESNANDIGGDVICEHRI